MEQSGNQSDAIEYNGATWLPVGDNLINISADTADDSLFVYDGTPYIACTDAKGQATVMEYDGTSWQPVGNPGSSNSPADRVFLFLDDGTPFLACDYRDANNNSYGVVMEYTVTPAITTPVCAGTDVSVTGTAAPGTTVKLSIIRQQPAVTVNAERQLDSQRIMSEYRRRHLHDSPIKWCGNRGNHHNCF